MNFSKYMNSPLDETYSQIPGELIEEGTIPEEEMEVRRCLAAVKVMLDKAACLGGITRLLKTKAYRDVISLLKFHEANLMEVVNKSPYHKAAIHRIVSAMPKDNGGRKYLLKYLA